MIETDEFEDDYFTPLGSTTLASIFGNSSNKLEDAKLVSLKYTPTKAQNLAMELEDSSSSKCIFACVFLGFQWTNNIYIDKGKIGFAIVKNFDNNIEFHNIILYDSNKHTLSSAKISSKLKITVKGKLYISYYDDFDKYWSIYATEEEINKAVDILNGLNATVNYSSSMDQSPPEPLENNEREVITTVDKVNTESDTDSYVNKKTRESILTRMANMGQSVLPMHTVLTGKASDSSDTNDDSSSTLTKPMRHKPFKAIFKKSSPNEMKVLSDTPCLKTCKTLNILPNLQRQSESPLFAFVNGNFVPVSNTNSMFMNNSGNNYGDFSLYLSEQRICNKELRSNINKTSDKVDKVLESIRDSTHTNFEKEILQKLLIEYENKIKMYEKIIISQNIDSKLIHQIPTCSNSNDDLYKNESKLCKVKIEELKQNLREKNNRIDDLNIDILKSTEIKRKENDLYKRTKELEDELSSRVKEITKLNNKVRNKTDKFEEKLKLIMNETYQSIAANFETEENYSGETIKSTVALVIKRVTKQSLK